MLKWRNRKLKDIPKDARKSLEVLDKVLKQIEKEEKSSKDVAFRRKSLDDAEMASTYRAQEDIRRSLEILDNVLAEFEDSGYYFVDSGSTDRIQNDVILRSHNEISDSESPRTSGDSYEICSTDGSTSQSTSSYQSRRFSPPPVPKRSPGTRLSAKENQLSPAGWRASWGPSDIPSLTSDDNVKPRNGGDKTHPSDIFADREVKVELLSKRREISCDATSCCGSKGSVEHGRHATDSHLLHCRHCVCTSRSENSPPKMSSGLHRSPSVAQRRLHFENKCFGMPKNGSPLTKKQFLNSDSGIDVLPVTLSPILKKKIHDSFGESLSLGSSKLSNSLSDSKINELSRRDSLGKIHDCGKNDRALVVCKCLPLKPETPVLSDRTNLSPKSDISLEERIRRLDERFAKVKQLIKEKKIRSLTEKPPNFVPPPPPKPPRKSRGESLVNGQSHPSTKVVEVPSESEPDPMNTAQSLSDPGQKENHMNKLPNGHTGSQRPEPLSHTIEDLPKLLPTDALIRPQYGLSYSMEDDLSPGVKDILTSTPKPEKILLSTFSQSVSSLGYGSSQSEQDLNVSLESNDKFPMTVLKSQTLPVGIRMVPPLSSVTDIDSDSCELQRSFDLFQPESDHFRSSSAPPLKHLLQQEKKSASSKNRILNGGDEISIISNSSAEESSRKSTTDSFNSKSKEPHEGKRRSVWKSILRRK